MARSHDDGAATTPLLGKTRLRGGRGVQHVFVFDRGLRQKLAMQALSMLTIALGVMAFHGAITARLGWRALKEYEMRDDYGYVSLDGFIRACEVCLSLGLGGQLVHMCIVVFALRWHLTVRDLIIGASAIALFLFIAVAVLIETAVRFLTTVRSQDKSTDAAEGGYCADGMNRDNPGCDDMIVGLETFRDWGAALLAVTGAVMLTDTVIGCRSAAARARKRQAVVRSKGPYARISVGSSGGTDTKDSRVGDVDDV